MLLTGNKVQIIYIISKYLIENKKFSEDIPVQAEDGVVSKKTDLKGSHERLTLTYQTTHGM